MVPLPVPSGRTPSQSDRSDTCTDLRAKAPPLSEVQRTATQSQKGSSGIGQAPQASPTSTLVSPDRHRSTSPSSADPGQQQQKVEAQTSLREHADLFQGVSSQSPAASAVALASPCLQTVKQEVTEPHSADRQQPEGLKHFPGAVDMHMFNSKQSPEDLPVAPANKGNLLPAQTFSSLLSKQPSVVMTQKPTAYVRPMDGPDQVVSESPELKPSPDSYTPPPELIIKTEPDKDEMPLQFLEVGSPALVSSSLRRVALKFGKCCLWCFGFAWLAAASFPFCVQTVWLVAFSVSALPCRAKLVECYSGAVVLCGSATSESTTLLEKMEMHRPIQMQL